MIGLAIGIINYENDIEQHLNPIDMEEYPLAINHPRNTSKFSIICRLIICITTATSVVVMFLKQYYRRMWITNYFKGKQIGHPSQIGLMHQEDEDDHLSSDGGNENDDKN